MNVLRLGIVTYLCMLLSGCLYGQCMDGPCALERSKIINSIKAYGQYWTKPAMTTESWRLDWVECGGRPNGSYGSSLAQGTKDAVVRADEDSKKIKLDACMQAKGYQFNYTK